MNLPIRMNLQQVIVLIFYIKSIHEQGVMAFTKYGNAIAVSGAAPCCGDVLDDEGNSGRYTSEWDWGN